MQVSRYDKMIIHTLYIYAKCYVGNDSIHKTLLPNY